MDFKKLAALYKDELMDNVLPFWLEHSQDHEFAGISLAWTVKVMFSIQISLFGCKAVRYGCFQCSTIR